jgi:hypothetical protein
MTTHQDMLYHLGGLPVMSGIPFHKNAKAYFVDPAGGNDNNDGLTPASAVAGLETAYGKCVANQHDTVFYIAGSSGNTLQAAVTWAKNFTHLIGICAPTMVAQRSRIFQLSTLTGASPLFTHSATGCIMKNFYIFQGVADATSLLNYSVTGGRNYFENVHFAGGGHATQAVDGCYSLHLNGAEENTFVNCTIGVDTIDAATGVFGIGVDGEATRNVFRNCKVTMKAGNGGAGFVELVDNSAIDRYMIFKRCLFLNSSATAMDSAFVIPAGMSVPRGPIVLDECWLYGATDWDANDRGIIKHTMGTATTGGNSGILLASTAA